ncbi:MAG: fructose-1,6-bisphosphatase [Bacteroidales bacterium]|nr:fructose-1,6-bisphosphatase [Bacteroidales bacterium]
MTSERIKYLKLLSKQFPSVTAVNTEIINLQAILNLPKATEHFISDIHGEYETFKHVLSNGSGVIRGRIDDIFSNRLEYQERQFLAALIYYPRERLKHVKQSEANIDEWFKKNLRYIIEIARSFAAKYSRSKVRKTLPNNFRYITDELLNVNENLMDKEAYFQAIIQTIIDLDSADDFIVTISNFIHDLAIDHLHIVGDIFDRGPSADKVMDELLEHKSIDIQWGNHDMVWMGAASGSLAYIAIVLRISARYGNLHTIENSYGINIRPLSEFASDIYSSYSEEFIIKAGKENLNKKQIDRLNIVHKAISIIQFKLEGQIISRNPDFGMDDRKILDRIDFKKGVLLQDGKEYPLNDTDFPTIDPKNPFELTEAEEEVMNNLRKGFLKSEKLQKHIKFLFAKGSMYLKYNGLLLFHGAIPLDNNGKLKEVKFGKTTNKGMELLDFFDISARTAFFSKRNKKTNSNDLDIMWYLWCGPDSPLFGKKKMATFERYFIDNKELHKEQNNAYFDFRDDVEVIKMILRDFDLNPEKSHIVNGHVPVKVKKGESPIKAKGKVIVIDGGMSKAYQSVTGLAGYTLIYNSYGLVIVAHQKFSSKRKAIEEGMDMISEATYLEKVPKRKRVSDTDIGSDIMMEIQDLKELRKAYNIGLVK